MITNADFQEIRNAIYGVYGFKDAKIIEEEASGSGWPNLLIQATDGDIQYRGWLLAGRRGVGSIQWHRYSE